MRKTIEIFDSIKFKYSFDYKIDITVLSKINPNNFVGFLNIVSNKLSL